ERASRNWELAKPGTRCCASCWWGVRTISWDRLDPTPTYDVTGCGWASVVERTQRRERREGERGNLRVFDDNVLGGGGGLRRLGWPRCGGAYQTLGGTKRRGPTGTGAG